jgi:hypothetical protein
VVSHARQGQKCLYTSHFLPCDCGEDGRGGSPCDTGYGAGGSSPWPWPREASVCVSRPSPASPILSHSPPLFFSTELAADRAEIWRTLATHKTKQKVSSRQRLCWSSWGKGPAASSSSSSSSPPRSPHHSATRDAQTLARCRGGRAGHRSDGEGDEGPAPREAAGHRWAELAGRRCRPCRASGGIPASPAQPRPPLPWPHSRSSAPPRAAWRWPLP